MKVLSAKILQSQRYQRKIYTYVCVCVGLYVSVRFGWMQINPFEQTHSKHFVFERIGTYRSRESAKVSENVVNTFAKIFQTTAVIGFMLGWVGNFFIKCTIMVRQPHGDIHVC